MDNTVNMVSHLSPTSLSIFEKDAEDFYLQYKLKLKRMPQTKAMAIGSAFDARIKSFLVEKIGGSQYTDDKFKLENLYNSQVEPHNRELVRADSEELFQAYLKSGAVNDLLLTATQLSSSAKFELDIKDLVSLDGSEVPIRGKPDMIFKLLKGKVLIQDWKVNGRYSKAYPKKGFINIYPDRKAHKDCVYGTIDGITINIGERLEKSWEDQVTTYGWLSGVPVGEDFLAGIEQIVCNGSEFRFATFRVLISKKPQLELFERYKRAWGIITSDHYFRNMSKEQSQAKCAQLDALKTGDSNDQWLLENTRN